MTINAELCSPQHDKTNQTRPPDRNSNGRNGRTSRGASCLSAPSPLDSPYIAPEITTPLQTSTSPSSSSESGQSYNHNNNNNHTQNHHHHSPDRIDHEPTASNTTRFKSILEAVNASGFPDFDCMVTAYYTASFEKSSLPAMSQRASRSRRLAKMLREMHESSERWPSWEARGLRESVLESASKSCQQTFSLPHFRIDVVNVGALV